MYRTGKFAETERNDCRDCREIGVGCKKKKKRLTLDQSNNLSQLLDNCVL